MVEAIKQNFPQREIADASFRYQREVDSKQRIVVGVNDYVNADDERDPDPADRPRAGAQAGAAGSRRRKARRDSAEVERTLAELKARRRDRREPDAAASSTAPAPAPPRARWSPPSRRSSAPTPSRRSSEPGARCSGFAAAPRMRPARSGRAPRHWGMCPPRRRVRVCPPITVSTSSVATRGPNSSTTRPMTELSGSTSASVGGLGQPA